MTCLLLAVGFVRLDVERDYDDLYTPAESDSKAIRDKLTAEWGDAIDIRNVSPSSMQGC